MQHWRGYIYATLTWVYVCNIDVGICM